MAKTISPQRIFYTIIATIVCSTTWASVAEDAYVLQNGNSWTFGTSKVEKTVTLKDGQFFQQSYKTQKDGVELSPKSISEEFFFTDGRGNRISSVSGGWSLVAFEKKQLAQGETQLGITLKREAIQATKYYVIYPGSSIVREWIAYKNVGDTPVQILNPSFLIVTAKVGEPSSTDFHWMSGGECHTGSWKLVTEKLAQDKSRTFDSFEPFPFDYAGLDNLAGDGVDVKAMKNDEQVWPSKGWALAASSLRKVPIDFSVDVAAGDKLIFQCNSRSNHICDTTSLELKITWEDGQSSTASADFSEKQGENGWKYQLFKEGQYVDMIFDRQVKRWQRDEMSKDVPFIGPVDWHPAPNQDAARVWTAPKAGKIHVTGVACNTGNLEAGDLGYGLRAGSASYAPWNGLFDHASGQGLFIGWDYFGHWQSALRHAENGSAVAQYNIAGHKQTLQPGESLETPKAFVGLYRDDLDNAGNECLDWQYAYLWDYTREPWFPAIRMVGYWNKGTTWGDPNLGLNRDPESILRKIFRTVDLLRYCGGDVYHRDWGWWDRAGDWNGPNFRISHDYLKKHGMGQLIYAFLYSVDSESKVAKAHPDWFAGGVLDMSKPEVVEFMKGQLDTFVANWGELTWRNDSFFTCPRNGDETVLLGQDRGFRRLMQEFLDKHLDCAFQGVNGGGNYGGYDYTRLSSSFSFSDGAVGLRRNYWAALMFPPDKSSDIPEASPVYDYSKAYYPGRLCICFDMYGDTWDPAKLEGVRQLIDIYHYLYKQDVVGRWVKVYRPTIIGDPDPTMYFERLSGDRKRSILIPKRPAPCPVTIKPKGLLPDEIYTVSFQESETVAKRTGRDLMENGIQIEKMPEGELVYLNLPLHPGSKLDQEPPTAPTNVAKRWSDNMGFPGVEIAWQAATDNNWISYYEVRRNGKPIDKVAKGTFYFDHSAGADLGANYEILTVDGAGNISPKTPANGPTAKPATVYDDADGSIAFSGDWKREANLQPAHEGTVTSSGVKGATAKLSFDGKRVLWFTKLGDNCGKAAVSIDGNEPTVVDTYCSDDIWDVCVFQKELPTAGRHTIQIEVLGEKREKAKDTAVYLDGIQVRNE